MSSLRKHRIPPFTALGLVACNMIWAANPIMGKLLLERFPSHQVAWLRYGSATAAYLFAWFVVRAFRPATFFARPQGRTDALLLLGLGVSAFCFAPLVGLFGLARTGAVDNAILIALEPLVTVGLAALFLRERFDRWGWLSLVVSILGFGLLSGLAQRPCSTWMSNVSFVGNLIIVVSLAGEGGYSIFARRLSPRYPSLPMFGTGLVLGFSVLSMAVALQAIRAGDGLSFLGSLAAMGPREWLALAWLGPLGSTLTYLYWLFALEKTDVSNAALTLFVQPVVGAFLGLVLFSEPFGPAKVLGGGLILGAVGLLTLGGRKTS